jgi:hypothetical protein
MGGRIVTGPPQNSQIKGRAVSASIVDAGSEGSNNNISVSGDFGGHGEGQHGESGCGGGGGHDGGFSGEQDQADKDYNSIAKGSGRGRGGSVRQ